MKDMDKSEEELDAIHNRVMESLYEIFEEEFDVYFKYYEIAMDVLANGEGVFPFDSVYDSALDHIEKSLEVIESNIIEHIRNQLEFVYKQRKGGGKIKFTSEYSEKLKNRLNCEIRKVIEESSNEG